MVHVGNSRSNPQPGAGSPNRPSPSGTAVTTYPVTAPPPVGLSQLTFTEPGVLSTNFTDWVVGFAGACDSTGSLGSDAGVPSEVISVTLKVYDTPEARPVTSHEAISRA